jgi:hypothetical protein
MRLEKGEVVHLGGKEGMRALSSLPHSVLAGIKSRDCSPTQGCQW